MLTVATRVGSQEPVKCKRAERRARAEIQYRIAKNYRTVESQAQKYPPTLVVFISVKERNFNRDDMFQLAKQLNEDFCKEPRLEIFIFSSFNAAKMYSSSEESPSYGRSQTSVRGGYHLVRSDSEEFITFSKDPSSPQIQEKLDIGVGPK
jgi:hypothetical protein